MSASTETAWQVHLEAVLAPAPDEALLAHLIDALELYSASVGQADPDLISVMLTVTEQPTAQAAVDHAREVVETLWGARGYKTVAEVDSSAVPWAQAEQENPLPSELPERPRYVVEVERDPEAPEWLLLRVPEIDLVTQAHNLSEVETMARGLIQASLDIEPDSFDLTIRTPRFEVYPPVRGVEYRHHSPAVEAAQADADYEMRIVLRSLGAMVGVLLAGIVIWIRRRTR